MDLSRPTQVDKDTPQQAEMSHKLSKKVGKPEPIDSTPEFLDKSQQPPASENEQSASESLRTEHGPQPAKLVRSTATYFDRSSIAAQLAGLAIDDKSPYSSSSETGQSESRGKSRYYSNVLSKEEEQEEAHKPAKSTRYYSWALSKEDKEALALGEESQDHKAWTAKDLVRFQESRLELVPRGIENRDAVIEQLNKDKDKAEQYLLRTEKKVRRFPSLPRMMSSQVPSSIPALTTYFPQSAQSTPEICVSDAPLSPSPPVSSMTHDARNVTVGDYFSFPPDQRPERPGSNAPFRYSSHVSRVRSPLSNEYIFEPRPDVTFDSFLEPHVSGKGEVYRRLENAGDDKGSVELETVDKKRSKRISMPSLRVRKSKGDVRGPVDE